MGHGAWAWGIGKGSKGQEVPGARCLAAHATLKKNRPALLCPALTCPALLTLPTLPEVPTDLGNPAWSILPFQNCKVQPPAQLAIFERDCIVASIVTVAYLSSSTTSYFALSHSHKQNLERFSCDRQYSGRKKENRKE